MRLRLLLSLLEALLWAPPANAQAIVEAPLGAVTQSAPPARPADPVAPPATPPVPPAAAADWLAYGRDAQLTNESPQPAITPVTAAALHELWSTKLDGAIVASPLAANGRLFVATEAGSVYSLDPANGSVAWRTPLGNVKAGDCGSWGISSTGAIDLRRGLLYIANADGSALWTALGNSRERDEACGCLVDDAGYGNSVVKLSPNLEILDSSRPNGISRTGDQDFGAAPVLFDVPGCGGFAAANNKDGVLYVWRRDSLAAGPVFSLGVGTTSGAPFIAEPSWSPALKTLFDASANVIEDSVSKGDGVVAIAFNDSCSVDYRWQTPTGHGSQPPPIVLGDVIFAAGGSGGWSALDARTGEVLWHQDTSTPTLAPPIAADGRIFAGAYSGELDAFGVAG